MTDWRCDEIVTFMSWKSQWSKELFKIEWTWRWSSKTKMHTDEISVPVWLLVMTRSSGHGEVQERLLDLSGSHGGCQIWVLSSTWLSVRRRGGLTWSSRSWDGLFSPLLPHGVICGSRESWDFLFVSTSPRVWPTKCGGFSRVHTKCVLSEHGIA